jgi:hypothetical protein
VDNSRITPIFSENPEYAPIKTISPGAGRGWIFSICHFPFVIFHLSFSIFLLFVIAPVTALSMANGK